MYTSSTSNVSTTTNYLWESLLKANVKSKSTSSETNADNSTNRAEMRDLIDKVAGDTASEEDIQNLASKLKVMATQQANRSENMSLNSGTSSDTEIKSLMEKSKAGTATSDDVKSIATKMKERASDMQAHFTGIGYPPAPPNGAFNDEMKNLIDKVADGTASDEEIKDLTTKLTEAVNQMQNLTQKTTATNDSSSDSELTSLFEKIKNGTATDSDIKTIATQMKEHHPAKPAGGKPPEGPPPTDDTDATSTTTSSTVAMEELLKLLSKMSTATSEQSADSTSSDSDTENTYSISASAQLMDSFIDAYSKNYNGVITTAQKVFG